MTQEALKLALEALEANDQLINGTGTNGGLVYCMDGYYSDCFDVDPINKQTEEAITAIKEALAKEKALQALHSENERLGLYKDAYAEPEQEPVKMIAYNCFCGRTMKFESVHGVVAPQRKPMTEWQPIETALKDGTYILLGSTDGAWVASYKPVYQSGYRPEDPWHSMMLNHEHMGRYPKAKPTHWQPLPLPPAAPSSAQPEQEPVAIRLSNGVIDVLGTAIVPIGTLLYTTPPQRTEQEPVKIAHRHEWFRTGEMKVGQMRCISCGTWGHEEMPQRTWVGLTTADQKEIQRQSVYVEGAIRMTEAKLKERNG